MRNGILLALAAATTLAACGSSGAPDEVVYGVAVYTQPKAGADFGFTTYYVDPVIKVRNDGQDAGTVTMTADVKAAIDAGMQAAGYVPADVSTAQVGLKLGYAIGRVDMFYSGGWCDIYYGWYGCYYPPTYAGSYKVGTAILGMYQQLPPAAGTPFPDLWFSTMYGVLSDYSFSGTAYNRALLIQGIERSFAQSPYLSAP